MRMLCFDAFTYKVTPNYAAPIRNENRRHEDNEYHCFTIVSYQHIQAHVFSA